MFDVCYTYFPYAVVIRPGQLVANHTVETKWANKSPLTEKEADELVKLMKTCITTPRVFSDGVSYEGVQRVWKEEIK